MITRTAVCILLGFASFAVSQTRTEKELPRIASPEVLAIEMAKALVSGDRDRVTALCATRKEMEEMLEAAWRPARPEDRQYVKDHVAEIIDARRGDFDRFQGMKKKANVREGVASRFEVVRLEPIYVKDGMTKIRHSRLRMVQTSADGKEEAFLISLDDMFIFPRGWAFTSIMPGIGKEASIK